MGGIQLHVFSYFLRDLFLKKKFVAEGRLYCIPSNIRVKKDRISIMSRNIATEPQPDDKMNYISFVRSYIAGGAGLCHRPVRNKIFIIMTPTPR